MKLMTILISIINVSQFKLGNSLYCNYNIFDPGYALSGNVYIISPFVS